MEAYEIKNNGNFELQYGKYFDKIHAKHIHNYGEKGAQNIVDNIRDTFCSLNEQLHDPLKNNNSLIVGKVQSGKTSNLELLTALAFDNSYNILVMYGGYDTSLLLQTTKRFKDTFDVPADIEFTSKYPAVFTTDDSDAILNIDDEMIEELLSSQQPIIFISMKRPVAMNKINHVLEKLDKSCFKALIIDDEGDQASLNIAKDKKNQASKTYKAIVKMKELLSNPLYLSVTATPHANIFLDRWSALRPDSIHLILPSNGYDGVETYSLAENNLIHLIEDDDISTLNEGVALPKSLHDAIRYFIVASAIKSLLQEDDKADYSDMIIHSFRTIDSHGTIYSLVNSMIELWKEFINNEDRASIDLLLLELEKVYNNYIDVKVKRKVSFQDIKDKIPNVIKRTHIILKNSVGKITQANESLKKHKIYIGGDLLQRGLTFKHLITTYFTRWSRDGGSMDTNMQRARWFGYREKYIDLCKVFTTEEIAQEFSALGEIEEDLWEQFAEVESGELAVSDVIIQTDNTRQKPTAKNKATYKKVTFKNRWIKQRIVICDQTQLESNNKLIHDILTKYKDRFVDTTAGSRANNTTAKYVIMDNIDLTAIVDLIQTVFDQDPFRRTALKNLIGADNIPVILLESGSENGERIRSMYPEQNQIKALMQGADSKDRDKINYEGDSYVIVDKGAVNIQLHKIVPKRNGQELRKLTQYMFAIYIPKEKTYYVHG